VGQGTAFESCPGVQSGLARGGLMAVKKVDAERCLAKFRRLVVHRRVFRTSKRGTTLEFIGHERESFEQEYPDNLRLNRGVVGQPSQRALQLLLGGLTENIFNVGGGPQPAL